MKYNVLIELEDGLKVTYDVDANNKDHAELVALECAEIEEEDTPITKVTVAPIRTQYYTVEIPNTSQTNEIFFLSCNGFVTPHLVSEPADTKWKHIKANHLTEEEIKQYFPWAWQWAKTVEMTK